jgi:hypothetical protein
MLRDERKEKEEKNGRSIGHREKSCEDGGGEG